uniref:F-box domain-containing protein n=1 Tax=Caenorhabditis tropicalis TaxID=1561998 RepID=A0A1I7TI63_9PELO
MKFSRFDFSLCSKRCKRLVQVTRHNFIGISIEINYLVQLVWVRGPGGKECLTWAGDQLSWSTKNYEYTKIDGRHMKTIIRASRKSRWIATQTPEIDLKVIVDHCKEIFRIPIHDVEFNTDRIENFMEYIPIFSECSTMYLQARNLSEEDIEAFKDQITVEYKFYLNNKRIKRNKFYWNK